MAEATDRNRPTLRDVAVVAGVSATTASRALTRRGDVAADTRARVIRAADSLGYERTWTKQGRPSTRAPQLNLVVGFPGEWTDRVVHGAWRAAARLGFDLSVKLDRPDRDEDWPRRISESQCAGVIFGLIQPLRADLRELRAAGIPTVVVGPIAEPDEVVHRVKATDWDGGYLAGEHLMRRGVSQYVSVLGRPAYTFGRERDGGFRAAINTLAPNARVSRVETGWTDSGPLPELSQLLRAAKGPVGVFACNDAMALRCYESAEEVGKAVGLDVLIVGFDDGPHAATADPPLTTLHQPLEAMATRAVEIIAEAPGESAAVVSPALPVHLVVRRSTAGTSGVYRKP